MTEHKEEWKVVDEVPGSTQGEILKGLLKAQGIDVVLSEEGAGRALGLATGPMANVKVLVPDSKLEEARAILKSYYSGELADSAQEGDDPVEETS